MRTSLALIFVAILTGIVPAHTWKAGDTPAFDETLRAHILAEWQQEHGEKQSAAPQVAANGVTANIGKTPPQAAPFVSFAPKVNVKWDNDFLYIESNGLPAHNMMVGITNWQQQVPLPHSYYGANAWRVPLHPVVAKQPASIKNRFLRGAIALAANGIPIFNPQNNRGEVSQEIGELDQWGGHCGRADDYHYHAAPLHLQNIVGQGQPVAFALDGYPIYGLTEPDGSAPGKLDEFNGHDAASIGYHYHASTKYPYINGGFHGEVVEREGQVDPQPRAGDIRGAGSPLRGAKITGFESTDASSYKLSYEVNGDKRAILYSINPDETFTFEYQNGREGTNKEVYTQRQRGGGGPSGQKGKGQGRSGPGQVARPGDNPLPRGEEQSPARPQMAGSMMDRNGDGMVSAVEFAEETKRQFALHHDGGTLADALEKARAGFTALDRNQDGQLDRAEFASNDAPPQGGRPPRNGDEPPRRESQRRGEGGGKTTEVAASTEQPRSSNGTFMLTSPAVEDGKEMPSDYTGDGSGATLPLEWKGTPAGTQGYALIMDHTDPQGEKKWYWTLYDIPASVTNLPKNAQGIGKVGTGFKGQIGYEPPRSKGPGPKTYVLTMYALSAPLGITQSPRDVNREVLLAATKGKVLASSSLHVVHTSKGNDGPGGGSQRPPQPQPPQSGGRRPGGPGGSKGGPDNKGLIKPGIADTIKVNVYADNWFMLYINGKLTAVDSIDFIPHNVVSVDILPEYPMTIAVMAKDNADAKTGMEYGDHIGDGGFIIKFADGTMSNAAWKARSFFKGPLNHDSANPKVEHTPIPENWFAVDFDDSSWPGAKEYTEERVNPKEPYYNADFSGAKFIWTGDLDLDNTIIFRTKVEKPGWKLRWNTKPDLDNSGAPFK